MPSYAFFLLLSSDSQEAHSFFIIDSQLNVTEQFSYLDNNVRYLLVRPHQSGSFGSTLRLLPSDNYPSACTQNAIWPFVPEQPRAMPPVSQLCCTVMRV